MIFKTPRWHYVCTLKLTVRLLFCCWKGKRCDVAWSITANKYHKQVLRLYLQLEHTLKCFTLGWLLFTGKGSFLLSFCYHRHLYTKCVWLGSSDGNIICKLTPSSVYSTTILFSVGLRQSCQATFWATFDSCLSAWVTEETNDVKWI